MNKFHFRINNGQEQMIETQTGLYIQAVGAAIAMNKINNEENEDLDPSGVDVEIWCPHLLPDYGPYNYRVRWDGGVLLIESNPKPSVFQKAEGKHVIVKGLTLGSIYIGSAVLQICKELLNYKEQGYTIVFEDEIKNDKQT